MHDYYRTNTTIRYYCKVTVVIFYSKDTIEIFLEKYLSANKDLVSSAI